MKNRISNAFRFLLAFVFAVLLGAVQSFAVGTADADVSDAVADYQATFGVIKLAMIAIGVFLLGWALLKKIRRA